MKTKCDFRTELLRVKLAQTRYGRVLLHLGCLTVRPSRWSWHWHGILRELSYAHRTVVLTEFCRRIDFAPNPPHRLKLHHAQRDNQNRGKVHANIQDHISTASSRN